MASCDIGSCPAIHTTLYSQSPSIFDRLERSLRDIAALWKEHARYTAQNARGGHQGLSAPDPFSSNGLGGTSGSGWDEGDDGKRNGGGGHSSGSGAGGGGGGGGGDENKSQKRSDDEPDKHEDEEHEALRDLQYKIYGMQALLPNSSVAGLQSEVIQSVRDMIEVSLARNRVLSQLRNPQQHQT